MKEELVTLETAKLLKEASRVTGISKNNISRSAVKQKSLAGGYIWKYKTK